MSRLSFSLISMGIVVTAEKREFKCDEPYYSSTYGLDRDYE